MRGETTNRISDGVHAPSTVFVYVMLYAAPVAGLAIGAESYHYWIVSAVGLAAWVLLVSGQSRAMTALACAVSSVAAVGNLALAATLHTQRTGFNERFFHHFDASSLEMAWHAYLPEVVGVSLYWAAMTAAPGRIAQLRGPGAQRVPRRAVWSAAIVAALTYAPAISLATYSQARQQAREAPRIVVARPPPGAPAAPRPGETFPNLVIIIAESLEASFANTELLGKDLTPALTALERDAVRFSNMVQLPSASWTMGGIVASQCALPLALPGVFDLAAIDRADRGWPHNPLNTLTGAVERLLPDQECLGDILERHGYRNVYIGSAPLAFAGKGAFLETHGYAEQYGWQELRSELPDPNAYGGWGLYDEDMLELAWRRLESLTRDSQPFSLMLLTVDTHDVTGRNVSASCGVPPLINRGGFTVRCADRLIANWIARVREVWPDTVIVLMSDHLAFPNAITDRIENAEARRLRFTVWGPTLEAREIARPGTHFDIGPTVLDILGLAAYKRHNLGASLLSFESPWLTHDTAPTMRAALALAPIQIAPGEPIAIEQGGRLIRIDGQTLVANDRGFALDDATFTLRFHDDGRLDTALPWESFNDLEANEAGKLVIGVSTNERFKRAIGAPAEADTVYFAGRVGAAAGLIIGAVKDRTEIALPEAVFRSAR